VVGLWVLAALAVVVSATLVTAWAAGSMDARGASGTARTSSLDPAMSALASPPWTAASPSSSPTAGPAYSPPLPAMLAAIGDSYTQAYDFSPDVPHNQDYPALSWAVGDAKSDGVFSLRERFESLGAGLTIVDAATSGTKMDDAVRQATLVVEAAQSLPPGATVYVTFALGTNDLCDQPKTSPAVFEAGLREAMAVLRAGLPPGSRILVMSVPDFGRLHTVTQANDLTRAWFVKHDRRCAPFLGASSRTSLSEATAILAEYDTSLVSVCQEIESTEGATGRLHCTANRDGLAARDFRVSDLSTFDYFHPSRSGQHKLAEAAWRLGDWGAIPLPADAAR
jgi:lysophospholipase L1-like esterase